MLDIFCKMMDKYNNWWLRRSIREAIAGTLITVVALTVGKLCIQHAILVAVFDALLLFNGASLGALIGIDLQRQRNK